MLKYDVETTYDRVAKHYADAYFDELSQKPFDRQLLDQFADTVREQGLVCEVGCGPGQVARYLRDRGLEVCGIDLSGEVVAEARRLNPDIRFEQGNMLALNVPDASFAAIATFYAIIHIPRAEVPRALAEFYRVLQAGGRLLVAFHGGAGEICTDDWFGQSVSVHSALFTAQEMSNYLTAAGFHVETQLEREPYPFEYPSQRVYIVARKA